MVATPDQWAPRCHQLSASEWLEVPEVCWTGSVWIDGPERTVLVSELTEHEAKRERTYKTQQDKVI